MRFIIFRKLFHPTKKHQIHLCSYIAVTAVALNYYLNKRIVTLRTPPTAQTMRTTKRVNYDYYYAYGCPGHRDQPRF
jgi:hypothetical protein